MKTFLIFKIIFLSLILASCSGGGSSSKSVINSEPEKQDPVSGGGTKIGPGGMAVDENLTFSGLLSLTNETDSTVDLSWPYSSKASSYIIFRSINQSYIKLYEINDPSVTNFTLTNLKPSETYKFLVKLKSSDNKIDDNNNILSVTLKNAPNEIKMMTLAQNESIRPNPTVRVEGVKSGDVISLFSNPECLEEFKIGSKESEGDFVEVVTKPLQLGLTNIYAKATNIYNSSSPCSKINVSYTRTSCPDGFIPVNAKYSEDFCVAKFEMKCVGVGCQDGAKKDLTLVDDNVDAVSKASGAPWVYIPLDDAKSACQKMGNSYDLITNDQWMDIAHDIESVDKNWIIIEEASFLVRGHTDSSPPYSLEADESDPFYGTENSPSSSPEQKRVMTLSNGEEIWDFSGNVAEVINHKVDGCADYWQDGYELSELNCSSWDENFKYLPLNVRNLDKYGSQNNYGKFLGGFSMFPFRGGYYSSDVKGGIFSLHFNDVNNSARNREPFVGFRCVYQPNLENIN